MTAGRSDGPVTGRGGESPTVPRRYPSGIRSDQWSPCAWDTITASIPSAGAYRCSGPAAPVPRSSSRRYPSCSPGSTSRPTRGQGPSRRIRPPSGARNGSGGGGEEAGDGVERDAEPGGAVPGLVDALVDGLV